MSLEQHLAQRVHGLRRQRGWTLEQLAGASGVSRSMISLIERAETSPTAAVLDKLADALGVPLAALFTPADVDEDASPLASRAQQPEWTDPGSGYLRRQVSPRRRDLDIDLVEVSFPPGRRVSFERTARQVAMQQLVWLLDGEMEITVGERTWRLRAGDCLGLLLDRPIAFHNPTRQPARYAVVITPTHDPLRGRSLT